MVKSGRIAIAALSLSASALVGIAVHEDYRDTAYLPTPHDVPTIDFGSTTHADGRPVKLGDRSNPVRGLIRLGMDVDQKQRGLRACIGDVPLYQHEFDAFVSWAYNVGTGAACSSTLVRKLRADPPDYPSACRELLRWDRQAGRVLPGLTKRRQAEFKTCMGEAP